MLGRRIIAVSPDKAFAKQLATSLKAAGGTVESHPSLEALGRGELQVALFVVHLHDDMAGAMAEILPRLTGDAKVIAVLPRANLAATVDLMQASERVAGVVVADQLDGHDLSAMATRILAGDIFGLEKVVPWGTKIHSTVVGDYQEKSLAIAQLGEYAELMGVRRKYREAVEQCVDEMLMNALYDAPVDDQGRQIFSEIPTRTRISLRVEQKVVVQYACDGKRFSVSVRDAFGTLERSTVLSYLYKCLHSEQQIDRKTGGAGLGLYLMANSASRLYFNVLPGVATEATCVMDLESPKLQLESFGFFAEKIDAAGRLAAGPSRRLPAGTSFPVERRRSTGDRSPGPRPVTVVLAAAIVVMLGLIAVVAYPRLFGPKLVSVTFTTDPPDAQIEVDGRVRGVAAGGTLVVSGLEVGSDHRVTARLDGHEMRTELVKISKNLPPVPLVLTPLASTVTIASDPAGATIVVGDQELGVTPRDITTLPPGTSATVTLKKTGFVDAVNTVEVPRPGKTFHIVVPLAVAPDAATVVVGSDPPGARVLRNGDVVPGMVTPTEEILVEANKVTRFTLVLDKHVPETIEARPSSGARRIAISAKLAPGVVVTARSNIDGVASLEGQVGCRRLAIEGFECVVKPGQYILVFEGDQFARASRKVDARKNPVAITLSFGFVEAKNGRKFKLSPNGRLLAKAALEEGRRTVLLQSADDPAEFKSTSVSIKAGKTDYVP